MTEFSVPFVHFQVFGCKQRVFHSPWSPWLNGNCGYLARIVDFVSTWFQANDNCDPPFLTTECKTNIGTQLTSERPRTDFVDSDSSRLASSMSSPLKLAKFCLCISIFGCLTSTEKFQKIDTNLDDIQVEENAIPMLSYTWFSSSMQDKIE